jgi:hypothetical protein
MYAFKEPKTEEDETHNYGLIYYKKQKGLNAYQVRPDTWTPWKYEEEKKGSTTVWSGVFVNQPKIAKGTEGIIVFL